MALSGKKVMEAEAGMLFQQTEKGLITLACK
jgi:hypothetical protein